MCSFSPCVKWHNVISCCQLFPWHLFVVHQNTSVCIRVCIRLKKKNAAAFIFPAATYMAFCGVICVPPPRIHRRPSANFLSHPNSITVCDTDYSLSRVKVVRAAYVWLNFHAPVGSLSKQEKNIYSARLIMNSRVVLFDSGPQEGVGPNTKGEGTGWRLDTDGEGAGRPIMNSWVVSFSSEPSKGIGPDTEGEGTGPNTEGEGAEWMSNVEGEDAERRAMWIG